MHTNFPPNFKQGCTRSNNDEVNGCNFVCAVVIISVSVKGHVIMCFGSRVPHRYQEITYDDLNEGCTAEIDLIIQCETYI